MGPSAVYVKGPTVGEAVGIDHKTFKFHRDAIDFAKSQRFRQEIHALDHSTRLEVYRNAFPGLAPMTP